MQTHALMLLVVAILIAPGAGSAQTASSPADDVSVEDVDNAARSIARYCRILVKRMDGLINESWATQDLGDLASVWDALNCHQVFGFDPVPVAPAPATETEQTGTRTPRWIVR